jgi:hypothetical protein
VLPLRRAGAEKGHSQERKMSEMQRTLSVPVTHAHFLTSIRLLRGLQPTGNCSKFCFILPLHTQVTVYLSKKNASSSNTYPVFYK